MWQEEEEALWDWLDDRIGLPEELAATVRGADKGSGKGRKPSGADDLGKPHKSMSQRELEHAISVTEDKLRILKTSIKNKAGEGNSREGKRSSGPPAEAAANVEHAEL